MRNIFMLTALSLTLTGCGLFSPIYRDKIVYVDRAVPSCSAPPTVPICDYQVDKLTAADINKPGKVGKAYVYDNACLRANVALYEKILQQYNNTTQDFSMVQKEIDNLDKTK